MPPVFTPVNTISQGQVQGYENQYGQAQNNYNQQQNALNDFQKNMVSGTDLYAQEQQKGNQFAGYDPAALNKALSTVQQTQNVIAGLPQAITAQNANYGATAGDLAGQYSGMMNNLNPALAAQSNELAKEQATQGAALNYAQQSTAAGIQVQAQKLDALKTQAANALQVMDQSRQTMQFYEDLYQKQGQFNSDEARQYAVARSTYLQAQAAMASAQAAITQANAAMLAAQKQPDQNAMLNNFMQAQKKANSMQWVNSNPINPISWRSQMSNPNNYSGLAKYGVEAANFLGSLF